MKEEIRKLVADLMNRNKTLSQDVSSSRDISKHLIAENERTIERLNTILLNSLRGL